MHAKRFLCLLLAILCVLPLFACTTTLSSDSTPPANGEEQEEQAPAIQHDIDLSNCNYTIIAPGGNDQDALDEQDAAMDLYTTIYQSTRIKLSYYNDQMPKGADPDANRTEILIGVTNRTESIEAADSLRLNDYLIAYRDERILILGGSAAATQKAVDYFIDTYLNVTEKRITIYENRDHRYEYSYLVGDLSVNDVPLKKYSIVYPRYAETNDPLSYYTAIALSDYLVDNAGISLHVVPDTNIEREYEILIGNTSRAASKVSTAALGQDQFYLHQTGTKLVMLGNSYLVAGAASELLNNHFGSKGTNVDINATDIPTSPTAKTHTFQKATSAILLIGDGMGRNHIDYTLDSHMLDHFVADDLPNQTTCTTVSQSVIDGKKTYTDSAAAATALATGYKTNNSYLGIDANKISRQNVRELAFDSGAMTAVITTDALTGATPSGFLCHHSNRSDTKELQSQIDALQDDKLVDFVYGSNTELIAPAREGLSLISKGNGSFFAMIEEAHIDKRAHYANSAGVWDSVNRYNEIAAYTICFVMLRPQTALIITADHETGGLIKKPDGSYEFDNFSYTEEDGDDYYQHTSTEVPVFALGYGTEELTSGTIDNTDIAKFIAAIYGAPDFGQ